MRSVPADDALWGADHRVLLGAEQEGMGNRRRTIARGWSACCVILVAALAGCSSPQRRHYLTLHSIAVEPAASANDEVAAAFGLDDYPDPARAVAALETEE